jgi:hypothetical protein
MDEGAEGIEMGKIQGLGGVVAGQELDDEDKRFAIEDPLAQARGYVITVQDKPDGTDATRLGLAQALALISIGESLEKLAARND